MDQKQKIFKEICLKSIFCIDNSCQLDHSRVYVGVCIEYLRNEEQFYNDGGDEFNQLNCNNENCNLWHLNQEKFKDLQQGKTINGIFLHNLCPKSCKSKDCKFLHREWADRVCLTNLVKTCRKNQNCEFKHEKIEQLKEKAKACSIIKSTTPEEICSKEKCNCGKHQSFLNNYCILYLKGLCPKKKCLRNHIDWEKINIQIDQRNSLKSCIQIAYEKLSKPTPNFNDVGLLCQRLEFIHYKKWFQEQNIIDVVFIMDLTGSMKPWKELMQQTIDKIIEKFLTTQSGYQVRVAFVGYRDICDKEEKLIYWSFTKKITEIQNFIAKLEVKGGGDEAEDVVSAFEQALKLNFSRHPDSLLCTFLLADAPCHGREYHDIKSDDLIDQMPHQYFEKVLEKYKQIKKNNFLCCVKINNKTDKMFEKMKAVLPMLTITTQKKPEDLSDLVGFTLRNSVTESIKKKPSMNNEVEHFKANYIKFKLDIMTNDCEDDNYWKEYFKFVDSIKREGVTGLRVTIDKNYLNKKNDDNSSTYIFKAFDAINNREVIIKIPKNIVDNQNTITKEDILNAEEQAKIRFYSSCYACQMAYFFNQRLKQAHLLQEMQPLFYAHPILYTLEKPFYGMEKVYGETYIEIQYQFEKYTNNTQYCNPEKYFYSAFSHFTLQVSKENLVITDLQGFNNILCDASVQTNELWESILDKDSTNRQNRGIQDFKSGQHQNCSYLCKKLNLDQINQNSQINNKACPKEQIKNKNGICYECDEFANFEEELLGSVEDNKFKFYCKFCLSESENFMDQECNCCNNIFQTPINQEIKKLTNLGICLDCKKKCQGKQGHACSYCQRRCQKIMKEQHINNQRFFICENAYDYLQAFICKKCSKPYNWKSIITREDYNERSFSCC